MAGQTRPRHARIPRQQDHSYQRNRFQRYCLSTYAPLWYNKGPEAYEGDFVNTEVHLFIQYIHRWLSHEAFDESVLGNMIDPEMISLLQFLFYPTETHRRHPISNHWTIDWDVTTIIEALEELYPLQAEHKHLDFGSRW